MLCSHLGFAIGTHHCGGVAVESRIMLGHVHLDCGMADMEKDCERRPGATSNVQKMPCCENEYLSLEIDNELKPKVAAAAVNLDFIAAFVASYAISFSSTDNTTQYAHYDPPLVTRDISILHQVFII